MKKCLGVLAAIIILAVMVLANCSYLGKSMRSDFGPAIEGEESEYYGRIISHYYIVKCCKVDGRKEIWVESNFLSEYGLKNLAIEIANFCSADLIVPLYYPNTRSYELFDERYLRYTYFVFSDHIELLIETNILFGGINAMRTEKFYDVSSQELIPKTVRRGYSVILEKNRSGTLSFIFENHRNQPVVFSFDKKSILR